MAVDLGLTGARVAAAQRVAGDCCGVALGGEHQWARDRRSQGQNRCPARERAQLHRCARLLPSAATGTSEALAASTQVVWTSRKVSMTIRKSMDPSTANAVRSETGGFGAAERVEGSTVGAALSWADTMGSRGRAGLRDDAGSRACGARNGPHQAGAEAIALAKLV